MKKIATLPDGGRWVSCEVRRRGQNRWHRMHFARLLSARGFFLPNDDGRFVKALRSSPTSFEVRNERVIKVPQRRYMTTPRSWFKDGWVVMVMTQGLHVRND